MLVTEQRSIEEEYGVGIRKERFQCRDQGPIRREHNLDKALWNENPQSDVIIEIGASC
jgi:hypothetical protein